MHQKLRGNQIEKFRVSGSGRAGGAGTGLILLALPLPFRLVNRPHQVA
jgi:hypothetical protein